jgi:hypothetical protein
MSRPRRAQDSRRAGTQGGASLPLGAPPGPSGLHRGPRNVAKGKVCINLHLDRQMFPFCSPEDIRNQVSEVIGLLDSPEGGLISSPLGVLVRYP